VPLEEPATASEAEVDQTLTNVEATPSISATGTVNALS
jgi:hypothetical protein